MENRGAETNQQDAAHHMSVGLELVPEIRRLRRRGARGQTDPSASREEDRDRDSRAEMGNRRPGRRGGGGRPS